MDDWSLGTMELIGLLFLLPIVGLHVVDVAPRTRRRSASRARRSSAVLAAGMVYAIITLYAGTADFIYFQF